ncbi:MFS transporter [Oceanicoccus sp. KOV_DT_Chl]|uniref:MFS transporter n=1 Tax=Oceanicoccus sp. KOV_DT_Chl TaxID=1904639 RepID=UPI00190E7B7C|nr:MFS transporter [Oceanicoccus sp. KOV_DT_Chl]
MSKSGVDIPNTKGIKLGPIWLEPGINRLNCMGLFVGSFFTIGVLTLISVGTNYVLAENLGIPFSERGTIAGDLAFWTEITQILLFSLIGVAADRIGRRPIFVAGLLAFGLGYFLYPFAESLQELTAYRVIYAAGLALSTGMLATVSADYPQNISRGKMIAFVGMLNGLGVVLLNSVFGRLPSWFVDAGVDPIMAGRYAHFLVAGLCVLVAVVLQFTLKPGVEVSVEKKQSLMALAKAGVREARNPRIALAYGSAFVARSDVVILGTFLVTWGVGAGEKMGLTTAEASVQATIIFVITQASALMWAPIAGLLMDRINRITGMVIFMLVSGLAFSLPVLIDNPLESAAIPIFILLGIGQISAFLGSQILIGQEAPLEERGSVVGMFNMMGAIGILAATAIGGRLFDQVGPWAPFMVISVANLTLMLVALYVRRRDPGPVPQREVEFWQRWLART